jgi:PAS domain S-box-containing protein
MQATIADVIDSLDRGTVQPVFQPVVDLRGGYAPRFEVLARWNHPQHGLILPKNFIHLAETNGLIGELTQQILRKAFRAVAHLPKPPVLAVNVSPIQLHYRTLPSQLREVAEDECFPLENLTVEITESALLNNVEVAAGITRDLRNLGCRLALDDFGTGYSNLSQLQALPFNEIKIDRSFVLPITSRNEARKIVATILGLGQSLGLTTVAEGIETQDQAELLLRMGADMGQGWLFGYPEPIDNLSRGAPSIAWGPDAADLTTFLGGLHVPPAQRLAHLRAIYESVPAGLCLLDLNLRYVTVNAYLARLYQLPPEALIGRSIMELLPNSYSHFEGCLRRAAAGEPIFDIEVRQQSNQPGEPDALYRLSCLPASDEAGEVIGISVVVSSVDQPPLSSNSQQGEEIRLLEACRPE